jgi:hypothetical protein
MSLTINSNYFLNSINRLIFAIEAQHVLCVAGTNSIYAAGESY